jgi:hypothetical protein
MTPTPVDRAPRTAIAIGPEVPVGDFTFHVHGVFESAVNLRVDGRRFLVTLVGPEADEQPQGIRLASSERFAAWPVRPGDEGRRIGRRLVFDGAATGRWPVVDLASAAVGGRREMAKLDPRDQASSEAWAECARWLEARQQREGAALRLAALRGGAAPADAIGTRLASAGRAIGDAIRAGTVDAAALAAARMIGLGTGLTPTGDDFLCGLLAALWCTRIEGTEDARLLAGLGAALATMLNRTTVVGATLLECAIAGSFSGALRGLAAELVGSRRGDRALALGAAMGRLCAMGHTSGMDTAAGFLFGLSLRTGEVLRCTSTAAYLCPHPSTLLGMTLSPPKGQDAVLSEHHRPRAPRPDRGRRCESKCAETRRDAPSI